jgi:hypothetical protein
MGDLPVGKSERLGLGQLFNIHALRAKINPANQTANERQVRAGMERGTVMERQALSILIDQLVSRG